MHSFAEHWILTQAFPGYFNQYVRVNILLENSCRSVRAFQPELQQCSAYCFLPAVTLLGLCNSYPLSQNYRGTNVWLKSLLIYWDRKHSQGVFLAYISTCFGRFLHQVPYITKPARELWLLLGSNLRSFGNL